MPDHVSRTRALVLVTLLVVLLGGCASAAAAPIPSGDVPDGVSVTPMTDMGGTISQAQALAVVGKQIGALPAGATLSAHLVIATDPGTLKGDIGIKDRPIWLVHVTGIEYPVSIPAPAIGHTKTSVSSGFIYIDAYSGAWLMSLFQD